MYINEITDFIGFFAPAGIACEKDNVGLQIGSPNAELTGIVLAIDMSKDVFNYALEKNCNLIITHHPFIFKPLSSIDQSTNKGDLIFNLIKKNITVFSAHTNLDFIKDGVSFTLAQKLTLKNIDFLETQVDNQYKLITFLPEKNVNNLITKLSDQGAGIIGNYSHCSFCTKGTGSFLGNENSSPVIGLKEILESVEEVKIEMVFDKQDKNKIIKTLYKNHPYEEPAFDIIPLKNPSKKYGFGAIGEFEETYNLQDLLRLINKTLSTPFIRFSSQDKELFKKIGVCGGNGKSLIQTAINKKCDAFITSDLDYHTFFDFGNDILLIDAGHYHTEVLVLDILEKKLLSFLSKSKSDKNIHKFFSKKETINIYITD